MSLLSLLGPWAIPLGGLSVVLVADALRAARAVAMSRGATSRAPHHTVLGWGVLSAAVGLTGSAIGLGSVAHGARVAAGGERAEVEAVLEVLGDGAIVAVTPAATGLALLGVALIAWLALQYAWALTGD